MTALSSSMTTPTALADLICNVVDGAVDERSGLVVFRARLDDGKSRAAWLGLKAKAPAFLRTVDIKWDGADLALAEDATPTAMDRFQITVRKAVTPGEMRLLFPAALAGVLDVLADATCIQIAQMGANETFTTSRSRVQLWTLDAAPPYAPTEALSDPRGLSVDLTGGAAVPADLRPWLLRGAPVQEGAAFQTWRGVASRRLLAAIADRVSQSAGRLVYHFDGPPSRSFSLTDAEVAALFQPLNDCAGWVFAEGHDVEVRHLLLSTEWARSYRADAPAQLGAGAIDSARAAYRAYVNATSRETIKALADLRQAVIDETQKVSGRAQDLTSGMGKDLAVAAAPFVLDILPEAAKAASHWVAGGLAVAAALFLVYSYLVQVYIDHRYFKHQGDARAVWRVALNLVLSPDQIQQFSEAPITESLRDYRRVRFSVGVFYAALVVVLAGFAFYNFTTSPAAAQATTAAARAVSPAVSVSASSAPGTPSAP